MTQLPEEFQSHMIGGYVLIREMDQERSVKPTAAADVQRKMKMDEEGDWEKAKNAAELEEARKHAEENPDGAPFHIFCRIDAIDHGAEYELETRFDQAKKTTIILTLSRGEEQKYLSCDV